jgi:hypothetical protein
MQRSDLIGQTEVGATELRLPPVMIHPETMRQYVRVRTALVYLRNASGISVMLPSATTAGPFVLRGEVLWQNDQNLFWQFRDTC